MQPTINKRPGETVAVADYGFQQTQHDDVTVFDVKPAPPAWGPLLIMLAMLTVCSLVCIPFVVGLLGFLVGGPKFIWFAVAFLAFGGVGFLMLMIVSQVKQLHRARRVAVRADAVVLDEVAYAREHISHLWVDYPGTVATQPTQANAVVYTGSHVTALGVGLQNMATDTGRRVGQALANRINLVAHGVSMRYGNQTVPLATGLTEGSAVALEKKVRACLSN
jgi:hypothetical protein